MEIKRVCALCFSATGNTKTVVDTLAAALAEQFAVPLVICGFTKPQERGETYRFSAEDIVIVGTPTYAGKMPNKILPDFRTKLRGEGAAAVAVVTYGGRSYDNALAELCAVLAADGFRTAAAGAFVGQHSFSVKMQSGRPDERDLKEVKNFAERIAAKLKSITEIDGQIEVPGDADAPYYTPLGLDGQPAKFLKSQTAVDMTKCTLCGLCAENCPMGIIDPKDPSKSAGTCIKCHCCIRNCPEQARFFDDPDFLSHVKMIEQNFCTPKCNEVFL